MNLPATLSPAGKRTSFTNTAGKYCHANPVMAMLCFLVFFIQVDYLTISLTSIFGPIKFVFYLILWSFRREWRNW